MTRIRPRLQFRNVPTALGQVQGIWTPETTELDAELHLVLPQVVERVGPLERVRYRLNDWGMSHDLDPVIRGRRVHLVGFWRARWSTITLIGRHGAVELATVMPRAVPRPL